jgi:DNA-binding response OmpR family regulator
VKGDRARKAPREVAVEPEPNVEPVLSGRFVLVVEDQKENQALIRSVVEDLLGGMAVVVEDGERALHEAFEQPPALILLDLMLPGMSGYEICRKLREQGNQTPVLMLTARGEEADRVLGLDIGADDYVTKPFSLRELIARVRALLRRAHAASTMPKRFHVNGVEIDFEGYSAIKSGKPLDMTRREFQLLRALVARAGQALSRNELLDVVVGEEIYVSNRVIDNHIVSLRSKLEPDPAKPLHLVTVRGVGYKWIT